MQETIDPEALHLAGFADETSADEEVATLTLVTERGFSAMADLRDSADRRWFDRQQFKGRPGDMAWLSPSELWIGWDGESNLSSLGHLPRLLPEGLYRCTNDLTPLQILGWGLGCYDFDRYRAAKRNPARLVLAAEERQGEIVHSVMATTLARDLINTPSQDMAPTHLEAEARALADKLGAQIDVIVGDELLDHECGAIHAVGRAAKDAPRLLDITWGNPDHPAITLVGKGITFDSGGLNLKPGGSMRLMKKDMGGAAMVMGLSYLIMSQALPIRLRTLIPVAENSIGTDAFRPGDVLPTHKGLTVEIDNTDAEGRLLLCDALSIACAEQPEMVIDYATLTGAARIAVGTEIAAMFTNRQDVALELNHIGQEEDDPVWPLPLHQGYEHMLSSKVADLVNSPPSSYAGASVAALFLQRFIDKTPWVHFDVMAFNTRSRPGRPEGGEAMALRAVYRFLVNRYAQP